MGLDDLWAAVSGKENEKRLTQAQIADIEAKIKKLKEAYNTIDDNKEALSRMNGANCTFDDCYSTRYAGTNADKDYEAFETGEVHDAYTDAISKADAIEDAINWKINELREQLNVKWGALSGLVNAIEDLYTQIRNWVN